MKVTALCELLACSIHVYSGWSLVLSFRYRKKRGNTLGVNPGMFLSSLVMKINKNIKMSK